MYHKIVKEMLKTDTIPNDLDKILKKIDGLCAKAGGALVSRQTIALIIYDYLKNRDDGK